MKRTLQLLALAVVIGALLDVAVFFFFLSYTQQSRCWDGVLDNLTTHPHIARAQIPDLEKQARHCAQLP